MPTRFYQNHEVNVSEFDGNLKEMANEWSEYDCAIKARVDVISKHC